MGAQQKCGYGEDDCYWEAERCDGKWNCREHGGDERGCGEIENLVLLLLIVMLETVYWCHVGDF